MFRSLLIITAITLLITSCTDKRKEMFLGTWKLLHDSITCTNSLEDSVTAAKRGVYLSPEAALAEQSKGSVIRGETLLFRDNGTYVENKFHEGEYQLQDSGVILIFMGIVSAVYTINNLTDKELTMTKGFSMRGHSHTYRRDFIKVK